MHGDNHGAITVLNADTFASSPQDVNAAIVQLLEHARLNRHRALLVLSGSQQWGWRIANALAVGCEHVVRIGAARSDAIPASKVRQLLGSECAVAVFDTHDGLHPDALAAVCGSVVAGGVLVLLTPPWQQWTTVADPDYERLASYPHDWRGLSRRFIQHVQQTLDVAKLAKGCLHVQESAGATELGLGSFTWPDQPDSRCMTQPLPEQLACLGQLFQNGGVAVVLAERGRGKSALLGFAAQHWMQAGRKVLLVAPSRAAAASVFRHAGDGLSFAAPDMLLQDEAVTADVLLIDEAAAIPLPMLFLLLARFSHVVLATTTDGYEGTGQGFLLRFLRELAVHSPGWQRLVLDRPVRWAANDPLETWLYQTLLLDAKESVIHNECEQREIVFERLQQSVLADNSFLLTEVYGLLRSAHYRTTPDDLRFLLDAPALSLYRLLLADKTVAVALVVEEGGIDAAMAQEIAAGRRRPRGHLLVQTLAVHNAQPQYLSQRVARVVRIAVHTQYQHRGLGSHLLRQLIEDQNHCGVKTVGSSFSAVPDVLAFWQKNGFELLRIGHRRQAASAAPSALVLKISD